MFGLARSLTRMKRGAEAIPILDECTRLGAGKPAVAGLIARAMDQRLRHYQGARDAAGCRETAAMWEKLGRVDAASLYTAARMRAIAAALDPDAGGDAEKAMGWLKKAVSAGYKDRKSLEQDKDLGALRDRDDFRKLIDSLPERRAS